MLGDQATSIGDGGGFTGAIVLILLLILTPVIAVVNLSETDGEVLTSLKSFLELHNRVNRGRYSAWNSVSSPCSWPGISCSSDQANVIGIDLANNNVTGPIFGNFSGLTELSSLDLSMNTIYGTIPEDLSKCRNLVHLNLSHNIIRGNLTLVDLDALEVLDLSVNRLSGEINSNFPSICNRMTTANLSTNSFNGTIDHESLDGCTQLQYLDLSANQFSGSEIWNGISRLREFSTSQNHLDGVIPASLFRNNCSLEILDLSENGFGGHFPKEITNCDKLEILNLWGNNFSGDIPPEIGSISTLRGLFFGNNSFSRRIPESLANLTALEFLDLSRNKFGGDVQSVVGKFTQLKFLVLHGNSYTGGLRSSGILRLPNVLRLDLSFNNFTGVLPEEISEMRSLEYLMLAFNQFSGSIPSEFGNLRNLQALDLAFNRLTGRIPATIGNLSSLLWLMLANNSLAGRIPAEIGNCSSLLWLNLANNQLSGSIPEELTSIGRNPWPTFASNSRRRRMIAGSGECLTMKRWIPVNYPPFSYVYTLLTRKSCRNLWDRLLKGHGLFPICLPGSMLRSPQVSGYLQLAGNQFSGVITEAIGKMQNFSLFHLGNNNLSGPLPPEIGRLQIVVLNISGNKFSGQIPSALGELRCLQNLDLSNNNFSGIFPASLVNLTEMNKFNVSFNPLIAGTIPSTGQLPTFGRESYLGDPLLILPSFIASSPPPPEKYDRKQHVQRTKLYAVLIIVSIVLGLLAIAVFVAIAGIIEESPEKTKTNTVSNTATPSWISEKMTILAALDSTPFRYAEIAQATCNFSGDRIIGRGGYGTVYRGKLADGRDVAVKEMEAEGEFRAEMAVVVRLGFPHPNLVRLYGWCAHRSSRNFLVYEYMEGGSLEATLSDGVALTWNKRIHVAIDVARALAFLHHECSPPVVHRDVKASNVLLDRRGTARVADFGLSRVVDAGDTHVSTIVAGTIGYVAPEYGHTWQATTKGDVYSFGVLAMELSTGRRAVDGDGECLVEWGRRVAAEEPGTAATILPVEVLAPATDLVGAERLLKLLRVGTRCTAEAPQARPSMKTVLEMLLSMSDDPQKEAEHVIINNDKLINN